MTTIDKLIQKMKRAPNTITPRELDRVLKSKGFEINHRHGSHVTYKDIITGKRLVIPISNPIKRCYIEDVLERTGEDNEGNEGNRQK